MYVPRAMYSFRMSFWTVPPSRALGTPWASPTATRSAVRMGAVALMVIETVRVQWDLPEQGLHVGPGGDRDPTPSDLALGPGVVRVVPDLRRQVERHRQAGLPAGQQ